jgi:hypothetical protein
MWNNIKTFFQKAFTEQPEEPAQEVFSSEKTTKKAPKKTSEKKNPTPTKKESPTIKPGSTSVIKRLKNQ